MLRLADPCLALTLLVAASPQPAGSGRSYVLDPARSSVVVHVGKAGLFSFAGHEHVVRAPRLSGDVLAVSDDLSRSLVTLTFEAAALHVEEKGEPAGDAEKVRDVMVGPRVLDAARFPAVTFRSTAVAGRPTASGRYELSIMGDLSLHGVTRSVVLPLGVNVVGNTLEASGQFVLRQTDYGMTPVSVAGVVKVKDELSIDYSFVATRLVP